MMPSGHLPKHLVEHEALRVKSKSSNDADYVNVTGDNMTGSLHVANDVVATGSVTIDSDTNGLVLGADQDSVLRWDNSNTRADLSTGVKIGGTGTSVFVERVELLDETLISDLRVTGSITSVDTIYGGNITSSAIFSGSSLALSGSLAVTGDVIVPTGIYSGSNMNLSGSITVPQVVISDDITVSGEMKGARMMLPFHRTSLITDGYLGFAASAFTSITGFTMPRQGSIVGLSMSTNVSFQGTAGSFTTQARVNDVEVLSTTINTAGTGSYVSYTTQSRNVDVFNAGDIVHTYIDFHNFVGSLVPVSACVELQMDT